MKTSTTHLTKVTEPLHRFRERRFRPVAQPVNESVPFVDAAVDATVGQSPIMDNRQPISTQLIGVEDVGNRSLAFTAGDAKTRLQGGFCFNRKLRKLIRHICD